MGILGFGLKVAKTIKSVKPFSKTGGKTVEQVKAAAAKAKKELAKFNLGQTLEKTNKALKKFKKTVKEQKKILED